jgi:hypothetical protein
MDSQGAFVLFEKQKKREFFSWRGFRNRQQLAACAGRTPTPYASGDDQGDQGISKAGNRRIRALTVELSWLWLRYQPDSTLSRWYRERFATDGKRMRHIGIVALARKLLIALWRYLEQGEIHEGAVLCQRRTSHAISGDRGFPARIEGVQVGERRSTKKLWEIYSAMTNSHGGVILLGVKRRGQVFF